MVLLEMAFNGEGGLESLVGELADAVEAVLAEHGEQWSPRYPITLRETLRLGLQQQIVAGHRCPRPGGRSDYRVWMTLPLGGLRAWTGGLARRVVEACQANGHGAPLEMDVQAVLVDRLGPCLHRADPGEALSVN